MRMTLNLLLCALAMLPPRMSMQAQQAPPSGNPKDVQRQAVAAEPPVTQSSLVAEALEKSHAVQAARSRYEALRHVAPQARSLPDPQVSVGWMGNATPFSVMGDDPSSYRGIQAMQAIPFPGKLGLRGQIADKDAQAAEWDYEAVRRNVTAEVKTAYFDYLFYTKAIEITEKNRDLLTKLSQIAEARYRVGKGIQQDVLRAQTELSLILERLTELDEECATAKVRLNTLLSRPPETPLGQPAEVQPAPLPYSLTDLYVLAQNNDPILQREQKLIDRNQDAEKLARKQYNPDFGIGYMYQERPEKGSMYGMTFSLNIPVFYRSKQRQAVKQAAQQVTGSLKAEESRADDVNFELKRQYLKAETSKKLYELYGKGVVPQASLALESSMSSYEVGNADFLTVLANFTSVLQYQVEYYHELANYEVALTRMEPLVGRDLTSVSSQNSTAPKNAKD